MPSLETARNVDTRISPETAYLAGLRDGLQIAHAIQFGALTHLFPRPEDMVQFGKDEIVRTAQQYVDRGELHGLGDRLGEAMAEASL